MADRLREIVLPAFTDDTLVREARGSSFHLLDVQLAPSIAGVENEPVVTGRFVQDTTLRREQVYDPASGKLIPDEASLATSPSAFFILFLKDHRLVYFAETRHAPTLASFQSTMQSFLTRKHRDHIEKIYKTTSPSNKSITKKALKEELPVPNLTVVQLTNSEDLNSFIDQFEKLQKIEIVVHQKNDEPVFSSLIQNLDELNDLTGAKTSKVISSDNSGLDKEGTKEALRTTTDGANETIRLSGVDETGNRIAGENEDFSITTIIEDTSGTTTQKADKIAREFLTLVAEGKISRPDITAENVTRILEALRDDDQAQ